VDGGDTLLLVLRTRPLALYRKIILDASVTMSAGGTCAAMFIWHVEDPHKYALLQMTWQAVMYI
jgi:hypothetical protein